MKKKQTRNLIVIGIIILLIYFIMRNRNAKKNGNGNGFSTGTLQVQCDNTCCNKDGFPFTPQANDRGECDCPSSNITRSTGNRMSKSQGPDPSTGTDCWYEWVGDGCARVCH